MIKTFKNYIATSVLSFIFIGCASTNYTLDPNGVYKGDKFLYQTDQKIVQSYSVVDSFLILETQNKDYLKKNVPSVFNVANALREEAPQIVTLIGTARDTYIKAKASTNTDLLISSSNSLASAVSNLQLLSASSTNSLNSQSLLNQLSIVLATNTVPLSSILNLNK